ncbi:MAG TPA: AAA family ATPase [Candidatus Spyradosoma merdigallinarum]|uniref:AAA family ATPase n=1 Tax=Candidatus Spyradosoma merdigallinarum TaxID=2840950 RepID=A0A9D1NI26_9BACT|nr:AAA family ATPase [Candidatus Spyradosoma merdigallinarum]
MALNQASFAHDVPGLLNKPLNTTTRRIFVAATRQNDGKTTTSLGLFGALHSLGHKVSYIKPVAQRIVEVENGVEVDEDTFLLNSVYDVKIPIAAMSPVAVDSAFTRRYLDDPETLSPRIADTICRAFDRAAYEKDIIIVEGSGHAGVGSVFNASNADNARLLGSKVIIVSSGGIGKPVDEIAMNKALFDDRGVECIGVILNKVLPEKMPDIRKYVSRALDRLGVPLLGLLPLENTLSSPNLSQIVSEIGGRWIVPLVKGRSQRAEHIIVGAMSAQHIFDYIRENTLIIAPGDREDLLFTLIAGAGTSGVPKISGIILSNGLFPAPRLISMLEQVGIPVVATDRECFESARRISRMIVKTQPGDADKVSTIEALIRKNVDLDRILAAI